MERNSSLGTDETGELSRDWTLRGLWDTLVGFVFILVEMRNPLSISSHWETHSEVHFGSTTLV